MDLVSYYDSYWSAKDDGVDYARLGLIIRRIEAGENVLEVGCGPGMLAMKLKEKGAQVTGVDLSRLAIERAVKKGIIAIQVDLDTQPLPFVANSFDAVVSDSALEHIFFSRRAIEECVRVLRPGGKFILLLPNVGHWILRLALLMGRFPYVKNSPTDETHIRFYTVYEAKRICKGLGLQVEAVDGSASLWVENFYPPLLRRRFMAGAYSWAAHRFPSMLARDFILICRKRERQA